ncbi:ankyrin repeat-containing protein ITN1-like [Cucumis melo var. makuwa]|uniref:Ankyrin repeat-containing protein ITN1-like n=1 Tax=Cucumis melo var. makuwa TaxID=1194695 RepID=A0A5A7VFP9_CUCMM|nr:ankyrin repeat-containing protein ITN1-like [Cucumis melo var. makuwa]TYK00734.1 ankyrin repeat-containing protein ITN1-like [Cucumis melo var. makuwa]
MASRVEEDEETTIAAENQTSSEKSWQKTDIELLMVIITFIGTISFQAGTNPPGGVWQDGSEAGKSIMASKNPSQFLVFIVGVSTAMVLSAAQLMTLMNELPYNKLSDSRNFIYCSLGFIITALGFAYGSSVTALTPSSMIDEVKTALLTVLAVGAVVIAIVIYIQKKDVCSKLK